MAVPLIGYFAIGGSVASGGGALGAALPLLACVALHGAIFFCSWGNLATAIRR